MKEYYTWLFGRIIASDLNQINQKSKIDLSRIPPCQDSFIPHCQRANHRLGRYKQADNAIIEYPKPSEPGQGWDRKERGEVEPVCDESCRFFTC